MSFLSFLSWCWELPVALADELPLLWSFMLPLWVVVWDPVAVVWPVVAVDCAWTAVAPSMAAAADAPSRAFRSLFIFISLS